MASKTNHERLIDDLFDNAVSPREHAAVNEIKVLRERLAEFEKPAKKAKAVVK